MTNIDTWHETPGSSTIAKFGYDESTQELVVQFKSGTTYVYGEVPDDAYVTMLEVAETEDASIGKHFAKHIRGKFDFAKSETKA